MMKTTREMVKIEFRTEIVGKAYGFELKAIEALKTKDENWGSNPWFALIRSWDDGKEWIEKINEWVEEFYLTHN